MYGISMMKKVIRISLFFLVCYCVVGIAQTPPTLDYPVYVAQLPNLQNYALFANGGWDGNWYVGSNSCWVKLLPPIPQGNYARAYIGAKLGRAKTQQIGKRPWDKKPLPGELWIAVNSTPTWPTANRFLLTPTEVIPWESDVENALEGAGESQWFWVEVPLSKIDFHHQNYIALWSPTTEFVTVSSAPVLAAGWGGKEPNTWLAHDTYGNPPDNATAALQTPLSYFQPAIALKLISQGLSHPVTVRIIQWNDGTTELPNPTLTVDPIGDEIDHAWLEYFQSDQKQWKRVGRRVWRPPYMLTIDREALPQGKVQLRAAAVNLWEEVGYSPPFTVDVSINHAPTKI